jgi:hypothetical protein
VSTSASDSARATATEGHGDDNASLGAIVSQITSDFTTLMKQEVELAKAEVSSSAKSAGVGVGLYGGTGLAVHFAMLFVSLALWWWIGSTSIGYGWAALIGAAVWALIGAVLALRARQSLHNVTGIQQTAETARQIPDALKGKDHQQ